MGLISKIIIYNKRYSSWINSTAKMIDNDAAKRGPQGRKRDPARDGPQGNNSSFADTDDNYQRMDDKPAPNPIYFPRLMNRAPGDEAEKLRHHLLMMLIFHLTFLIAFEIWMY